MSESERAFDWRELAMEADADALVPPGYVEMRDADGRLLRRQWIGSTPRTDEDSAMPDRLGDERDA